jgi:carbamoyltransferase
VAAREAACPREIEKLDAAACRGELVFTEHHESHAASAFFPSPFEEAAILTLDGVGEWATTSWASAAATGSSCSHEMRFPHSLGLLYSAFTYFTGFKVNSGEYKLMGLAPYGEPKYADLIRDRADRPEARTARSAWTWTTSTTARADDDQRALRRAVRRPAAQARDR